LIRALRRAPIGLVDTAVQVGQLIVQSRWIVEQILVRSGPGWSTCVVCTGLNVGKSPDAPTLGKGVGEV
jgi:hypothetical protein